MGSEAIERRVKIRDLRIFFLPRLRLSEVCEVGEIQSIPHEFIPMQIVPGHGCELHTSKLDENIMFRLLDVGYVSEVTKQVVHVPIAQILL